MKLHTILGAGGAVSNQLLPVLLKNNERVRLVSRRAQPLANVEAVAADVTDYQQTLHAIKGSSVVYLLVGLTYDIKVWRESWPKNMTNVINACKETGSKLIFFDNVYMYGKVSGEMTEETPFNPNSKKGEVRARIANMILDEVAKGKLKALIARAPDFYGPQTPLSFINVMLFENYAKGKKGQLMISDSYKHSLIYTPDAAKATAILGNTDAAFNQVWHLPTDKNVLTMKQIADLSAAAFNMKPGYMILPKWMLRILSLFIAPIKESLEMLYQNDSDYLFDSSKFDKTFQFTTTTYAEGIKKTAASYK